MSSLLGEDEDGNVPGIRRASDQMKANRREVAAPVINLLEQIVETRSTELAQICRSDSNVSWRMSGSSPVHCGLSCLGAGLGASRLQFILESAMAVAVGAGVR